MRLATIFFCEYAATTREGKLDAGGILNLVWGPAFPLPVTQLILVVNLELEEEEYGSHAFRLVLESGSGDGRRTLVDRPFPAGGRFHRACISLAGLSFPAPGLYRFRVIVDNHELGDATLVVTDTEPIYPAGAEAPLSGTQ